MSFTLAQLQIIRDYIIADPVLSLLPDTGNDNYNIAAALNSIAIPDFIVWRTSVPQDEITQNGFDWTRVDNLSTGAARVWEWMFDNQSNSFNPSKLNVRAGIEQVWKGTTADLNVRAAVYVHCKRQATVLEKILASGTGTDAVPGIMGFEGSIYYTSVHDARAS